MRFAHNGLVVIVLMLIAASAFAQQQRGDVELQFQGMYFTTIGQDMSFGSGMISGKIGPYITDALQIGIGPTLSITTTSTPVIDYTLGRKRRQPSEARRFLSTRS
jgi:hypothetical protein